jgi:hypothetical protein
MLARAGYSCVMPEQISRAKLAWNKVRDSWVEYAGVGALSMLVSMAGIGEDWRAVGVGLVGGAAWAMIRFAWFYSTAFTDQEREEYQRLKSVERPRVKVWPQGKGKFLVVKNEGLEATFYAKIKVKAGRQFPHASTGATLHRLVGARLSRSAGNRNWPRRALVARRTPAA